MALINLKTNLKSLKFGNDQPGGGSSNQPYIQTEIPDNSSPFNGAADNDFLLRGGITAPLDAAKDVLRLSKFFADTKSPNGLFFILKQNLLSRTSVRTQASTGPSYGGALGGVNQGIYTPLSTLAQAGVGFTGTHLNLLGLDPSSPMSGVVNGGLFPNLGLNRYGEKVTFNQNPEQNRLVDFYKSKIQIKTDNPNLWSYGGGPGSVLGIGKTDIPIISNEQRTGKNNVKIPQDGLLTGYWYGNLPVLRERTSSEWKVPLGASRMYVLSSGNSIFSTTPPPSVPPRYLDASGKPISTPTLEDEFGGIENVPDPSLSWSNLVKNNGVSNYQLPTSPSVYKSTFSIDKPGVVTDFQPSELGLQNNKTLTQQEINEIGTELNNKNKTGPLSIIDFRKNRRNLDLKAPDYSGPEAKNIENRVLLGDPGIKGYVGSYETGKESLNGESLGPLDKINASKLNKDRTKVIYDSNGVEKEGKSNDLVKFRIASINSGGSSEEIYMHFRAFLDSFQDSYNATWSDQQYLGRGEKFYTYSGFTRTISLSWTVAAQSKEELIPMYRKLNYLASNLAPDYSANGYMRGPLVSLTLGGYLYEQPGFITSLTYDMPTDATWEIGINNTGGDDSNVKELCHIVKVTSFNFTPIQTFTPRKPINPINNLGATPFIALTAGGDSNY